MITTDNMKITREYSWRCLQIVSDNPGYLSLIKYLKFPPFF